MYVILPSQHVLLLGVAISTSRGMLLTSVRRAFIISVSFDTSGTHSVYRVCCDTRARFCDVPVDDCNAISAGSPEYVVSKLQRVLRAAARVIRAGTR